MILRQAINCCKFHNMTSHKAFTFAMRVRMTSSQVKVFRAPRISFEMFFNECSRKKKTFSNYNISLFFSQTRHRPGQSQNELLYFLMTNQATLWFGDKTLTRISCCICVRRVRYLTGSQFKGIVVLRSKEIKPTRLPTVFARRGLHWQFLLVVVFTASSHSGPGF